MVPCPWAFGFSAPPGVPDTVKYVGAQPLAAPGAVTYVVFGPPGRLGQLRPLEAKNHPIAIWLMPLWFMLAGP